MVCLIINGQDLPHQRELVEKLCEIPGMTSISLNMNKKRSNVILGDKVKTIWGKEYITDKIGDISYEISPLSFFQVKSETDMEIVFQSIGICRSSRRRDSLGSVLWNWDDFSVPCAEGKVCPWCGDCSGSN